MFFFFFNKSLVSTLQNDYVCTKITAIETDENFTATISLFTRNNEALLYLYLYIYREVCTSLVYVALLNGIQTVTTASVSKTIAFSKLIV